MIFIDAYFDFYMADFWRSLGNSNRVHETSKTKKKIMKKHIQVIASFKTLVLQIKCMLSSRPLSTIYINKIGLSALTPGHFFKWLADQPKCRSKRETVQVTCKISSKRSLQGTSFGKNAIETTFVLCKLKN